MRDFPTLRLALAFVGLLLATSSFAVAVDVLYVSTSHTITTYTVDPVTGIPSEVGNPLGTPNTQFLQAVIPAPDDRFIYVISSDAEFGHSNYSLTVYATDGSGVPQEPPVQTVAVKLWGLQFLIHPSGKFAYSVETSISGQEYASTLYLYHIDRATGLLTQDPKVQATYGPDYASLESLVGFNGTGARLYEDWSGYFGHGESDDNYSYHRVNGDTGALSTDVGFFGTSNFGPATNSAVFTDKLILVASTNAVFESEFYVYKNVKYPKEPLFACTQAMLHACYTAPEFWVSPDQQYVFLPEWQDTDTGGQTVVARIDVAGKQLVKMGEVPGARRLYFSPDDKLIYGAGWDQPIEVYRFNSSSGAVEPGGSITPVTPYSVWPAVRRELRP